MKSVGMIFGALAFVAAAAAAQATVVYSEAGFTFDLSPDSFDYFVGHNPNVFAYCPECTGSPNILTITRPDNQQFDLLSTKLSGFVLTGWTITAESPFGTVQATANVSIGNGGQAYLTPDQPMGTGFVSTLYLVEHGGHFDCGCFSDMRFELGDEGGPVVTVLSNPVPEPATLAIFGLGLLGFAGLRRRHQD